MQEFWGLLLVLCLAIVGCSSVPLKDSRDVDDSNLSQNINILPLEKAILEQQQLNQLTQRMSPLRYHPFAALTGLTRTNILDSDLASSSASDQFYNTNLGNNPNVHQKRQSMRYHQCYFNPISCFRRRR